MLNKLVTVCVLAAILTGWYGCAPKKMSAKEAAQKGRTAIEAFIKDPSKPKDISGYQPVSFTPIDTLPGFTNPNDSLAFKMVHEYKGLNVASREVRRQVTFFFNENMEIVKEGETKYLDAMTKEEYKNLSRNPEGEEAGAEN